MKQKIKDFMALWGEGLCCGQEDMLKHLNELVKDAQGKDWVASHADTTRAYDDIYIRAFEEWYEAQNG